MHVCEKGRQADGQRVYSAQDLWTVLLHYFWERNPLGRPFVISYYKLLDVAPEGLAYLM